MRKYRKKEVWRGKDTNLGESKGWSRYSNPLGCNYTNITLCSRMIGHAIGFSETQNQLFPVFRDSHAQSVPIPCQRYSLDSPGPGRNYKGAPSRCMDWTPTHGLWRMPACHAGEDLLASKRMLLGIKVSHIKTSRRE